MTKNKRSRVVVRTVTLAKVWDREGRMLEYARAITHMDQMVQPTWRQVIGPMVKGPPLESRPRVSFTISSGSLK